MFKEYYVVTVKGSSERIKKKTLVESDGKEGPFEKQQRGAATGPPYFA